MNTKQITAGTLAMFMGFAFAAPGAMADETTEGTTTGHDAATDETASGNTTTLNAGDPSGEPGNQGGNQAGVEASDGSQGNAGGGDGAHSDRPTLREKVGQGPIIREKVSDL